MKTSVISPEFRKKYLERKGDKDAFEGTAIVFEGPEDYHHRINDPKLPIDENSILFIRNTGPVGYPGAAEVVNMLPPDRLVKGGVLLLPCVGDGRQSGTSASPSILNASPEAAVGGGLALLKTGDKVRVDIGKRRADILISDAELAKRKAAWKPHVKESQTPWQELQRKFIGQLASGACLDFAVNYQKIAADQGRAAALPLIAPPMSLAEQPLLDGDRQVGAVDQDDRPRRRGLPDGAAGGRWRREGGAGAGRGEARGGPRRSPPRPPATGRGARGWRAAAPS